MFRVCDGCHRHVKERERACPFCDALIVPKKVDPNTVVLTSLPRSRIVLLFGSVTVSTALLAACGGTTVSSYGFAGTDEPNDADLSEASVFGASDARLNLAPEAEAPTDSGDAEVAGEGGAEAGPTDGAIADATDGG